MGRSGAKWGEVGRLLKGLRCEEDREEVEREYSGSWDEDLRLEGWRTVNGLPQWSKSFNEGMAWRQSVHI